MSIFDNLKSAAAQVVGSAANRAVGAVTQKAVNSAVNSLQNKKERFTFSFVPSSPQQLMTLPEASLDSAYKTTALTMLALLAFETNQDACFAMLDALSGPEPLSEQAKAFVRDRLAGKSYKVRSFFQGATPQNNYVPTAPYVVEVSSNPYSFAEENRATMFVESSGADSPRQIKLRRKPSTNQWFITDIQCLGDIREPAASDPWA